MSSMTCASVTINNMKTFETVEPGKLYTVYNSESAWQKVLAKDCAMNDGYHNNWYPGEDAVLTSYKMFMVIRKDKPCEGAKNHTGSNMIGRLYIILAESGRVGYIHVYPQDFFEEHPCDV